MHHIGWLAVSSVSRVELVKNIKAKSCPNFTSIC